MDYVSDTDYTDREIELDNTLFGELAKYLEDKNVTDVDWNGYDLWITDLYKGRYRAEEKLTDLFITNFSVKLSNMINVPFNRSSPVLEASTQDKRISIFHESTAGRRSISIRQIPMFLRLSRKNMIISGYCPENILNLIENCVIAHCNIIVGGLPGVGKTEFLKYLSSFIPSNEKAGTYEDTKEIHYRSIYPHKDGIEIRINKKTFPYEQAISAGLRHNIKWTLLSEARGKEVFSLLNNLSTGTHCLTTIHTESAGSIPDRIFNMIGDNSVPDRYINNIYRYVDVGLLIECDTETQQRHLTQMCFYIRENGKNSTIVIYDDGVLNKNQLPLPKSILHKFNKYGIEDIFANYPERKNI